MKPSDRLNLVRQAIGRDAVRVLLGGEPTAPNMPRYWLPGDTAPVDGRLIWGWIASRCPECGLHAAAIRLVFYDTGEAKHERDGGRHHSAWVLYGDQNQRLRHPPKWWMPYAAIPEPPA